MLPETVRTLIAIVAGLLLGSVLPADILGRLRGIDIRAVGDGNPGTVNAIRELGLIPGLITAAYDISVGVIAMSIAGALGLTGAPVYLAGLATVVGHRLPVYRGFRGGGEGMAASAGLLVYGIGIALARGWLGVADLGVLAVVLVAVFAVTRSDSLAAAVMLPLFMVRIAFSGADPAFVAFEVVLAAHIWVVQVARARQSVAARRERGETGGADEGRADPRVQKR